MRLLSEEKGATNGDSSTAHVEKLTFQRRVIPVFGAITDKMANEVISKLIAMDAASEDPITLILSSPGGHLESGDAMHDAMNLISAPVRIVGTGWVGSAATHLYLGVTRQQRLCTPNTRFLIHQPSGGAGGAASDIAIQAREMGKAKERIARTIADKTGQPIERVRRDVERDHWMSPDEAIAYGLVSRVIQRLSDL